MADEGKKIQRHWPVITVVAIVAGMFLIWLFSFQVENTEFAVVKRFGKPVRQVGAGWHPKLPWETVWTVDNRIQCFDGNTGVIEEVFTKDGQNIIITTYICWRVSKKEQERFMVKVNNLKQAQDELTALLRSHRNGVIGQYNFSDLINIDSSKLKIKEVEAKILQAIKGEALTLYGIDVTAVGIKHIGFPESVTTKVFDRMRAEREAIAQDILSQGDAKAIEIKAEANRSRQETLAEAEKKAKGIRAAGDAEAAGYYAEFQKNPELASFLRRLDSLSKIMSDKKTTLVLDRQTPPFDLLEPNTLKDIQSATARRDRINKKK